MHRVRDRASRPSRHLATQTRNGGTSRHRSDNGGAKLARVSVPSHKAPTLQSRTAGGTWPRANPVLVAASPPGGGLAAVAHR
jgi:hypothetical protein